MLIKKNLCYILL